MSGVTRPMTKLPAYLLVVDLTQAVQQVLTHPSGAGSDRHSLRPVPKVEDLTGQDPPNRGERVREVDVVDVDEGYAGPPSCFVRG